MSGTGGDARELADAIADESHAEWLERSAAQAAREAANAAAPRARIRVTVHLEIPTAIDPAGLTVAAISLETNTGAVLHARPLGVAAYLAPDPPQSRVVSASVEDLA